MKTEASTVIEKFARGVSEGSEAVLAQTLRAGKSLYNLDDLDRSSERGTHAAQMLAQARRTRAPSVSEEEIQPALPSSFHLDEVRYEVDKLLAGYCGAIMAKLEELCQRTEENGEYMEELASRARVPVAAPRAASGAGSPEQAWLRQVSPSSIPNLDVSRRGLEKPRWEQEEVSSLASRSEPSELIRAHALPTASVTTLDTIASATPAAESDVDGASRRSSGPSARRRSKGSTRSTPSAVIEEVANVLGRARQRSPFAKQLWLFLDEPELVLGGNAFKCLMTTMTILSAVIPLLQTLQQAPLSLETESIVNMILDGTCSLELLMRFFACPNFWSFFRNLYHLIDVIAGPISMAVRASTTVLVNDRIPDVAQDPRRFFLVCCLPVIRLSRLLRRFDTMYLLYKACWASMQALPVLLYTLAIIVLFYSGLIYSVEPRDNIANMFEAIYFTLITIGTVGYGDIAPLTPEGSFVVCSMVVVSSLYMAIPIGVVGYIWSEIWATRDQLLLAYAMRRRFHSVGFDARDVPTMFMTFDSDGDGELCLGEFITMMVQLEMDVSGAKTAELFHAFDRDGSGAIDDSEFVKALFPEQYKEVYECQEDCENELKIVKSNNSYSRTV